MTRTVVFADLSPFLTRATVVIVLASALVGCSGNSSSVDGAATMLPEGAQAFSLLGDTLYPPPLPAELQASREADLASDLAALAASPGDPGVLVWVGRREAYLGLYRESIETFTQGVERFPDDARFLRHRGHRWLTVREFDRAADDLSRGARMTEGQPDEIEPDGLPNALGIPLSTLQFNLRYHLALAHYLRGDFQAAAAEWERCLGVSLNPDLQVATRYWYYLTLSRLGRAAEARSLLDDIPVEEDVIENDSYRRLLLLFRGDVTPEFAAGDEQPGSLGGTTTAYGIGAWHRIQGSEEEAMRVFQTILSAPEQWAAFGYIAAEAEVARSGS